MKNCLSMNKVVCLLAAGIFCGGVLDMVAQPELIPKRDEQYRPQLHFSPLRGWNNDPNGLVWLDGEYHLYYQYNPNENKWGPMHWGHAVSRDLIHWEDLPIALYPDKLGTIFSGSAVVDWNNTAGFGEGVIVAIYTSAGEKQTQSIAYSTDKGRTFTKYEGNPVIPNPGINDFRDPKVFWHEDSEQWVMSLATGSTISFYGSPNLKQWEKLSEFGEGIGSHSGVWECPDLFPLVLDKEKKWVLLVSNGGTPNGGTATQYFVGKFDGREFCADPAPYPLWLDSGRDNYASVTWSDEPNGRRLVIGWMSNWDYANQVPSQVWRGGFTLPRELTLTRHPDGHALLNTVPAKEILSYAGRASATLKKNLAPNESIGAFSEAKTGPWMAKVKLKMPEKGICDLVLSNNQSEQCVLRVNADKGILETDRSRSGKINFHGGFVSGSKGLLYMDEDEVNLTIFVDSASVEMFVENGVSPQTTILYPKLPYDYLKILNFSDSDKRISVKAEIYPLESIWKCKCK